jgi:hypothetical protein
LPTWIGKLIDRQAENPNRAREVQMSIGWCNHPQMSYGQTYHRSGEDRARKDAVDFEINLIQ